jgi:hypothetical protein
MAPTLLIREVLVGHVGLCEYISHLSSCSEEVKARWYASNDAPNPTLMVRFLQSGSIVVPGMSGELHGRLNNVDDV